MTNLPPALDKAIVTARGQAQDRAVAKIAGMTVAEYDADTTAPDPSPWRYSFNKAVGLLMSGYDRHRFWLWLKDPKNEVDMNEPHTQAEWQFYYDAFVAEDDDRGERNASRYLDGKDELFDPHLDAFL